MNIIRSSDHSFSTAYDLKCARVFQSDNGHTVPFGGMWCHVEPRKRSKSHSHHESECFIIVKGFGSVLVNGIEHNFSCMDIICFEPFEEHIIFNTSESEELVFLGLWWENMPSVTEHLRAEKSPVTQESYLVVATPPTPNGDLHLGHLSGPYLSADLFSRYQRMRGNVVKYVTGTDPHQSYVAVRAQQLGTSSRNLYEKCSAQIRSTLQSFKCEIDVFLDPGKDPIYITYVQEFFRNLYSKGWIVPKTTESLFCVTCNDWLFQARVKGRCPHCNAESDGNSCEACCLPNDCSDLLEPRCKLCGSVPERKLQTKLYFRLSEFKSLLRTLHLNIWMNSHVRYLCETLGDKLGDVAIAFPSNWGISVPIEEYTGHTFDAWFEMAPAIIYMAEHASKPATQARVVQFFGFDNSFFFTALFPALYAAAGINSVQVNTFITNEFYLLEGSKFSTSRGHAIWGTDFLRLYPADNVRFFLALNSPEHVQTNFYKAHYDYIVDNELLGCWNSWLHSIHSVITRTFNDTVPSPGSWNASHKHFMRDIDVLSQQIHMAYSEHEFSPSTVAQSLIQIVRISNAFLNRHLRMEYIPSQRDDFRTTIALSLLAARELGFAALPIMPTFSTHLLNVLGIKNLTTKTSMRFIEPGLHLGGFNHVYLTKELKPTSSMC